MELAMVMYNLLIDKNIPIDGCCPDVDKTGVPRVDYKAEATPGEIAIGDKIADGFNKADIVVDGATITATVDESDTSIVFTAYNTGGVLQQRKTITTVAGMADYEIVLMPGAYVICACGIISYMSGFIEVTV